jgi:hypothetical protein
LSFARGYIDLSKEAVVITKKQLIVKELWHETNHPGLIKSAEFNTLLEKAISLTLLQKKLISEWQYDACVKEVQKNPCTVRMW